MMKHGTQGVVINMSSNHVEACFPDTNIYAPSKAAVTTFYPERGHGAF